MLKAIKLKLYLNKEQKIYVNKLIGSSRYVYNSCLSHRIEEYKSGNKIGFKETSKHLTELKQNEDTSWLKESHSKVLQQNLIDLDQAYKSFFKMNGSGFPRFKAKHGKESCRFPVDAIMGVTGNRINIIRPLKDIHFKCSKRDEIALNKNQIKSGTLTKTKSGNYVFSVLIDTNLNKSLPKTKKTIGIDLGIKDFIVTSDNKIYENIKIKRNNKQKLKKLYQNLSKKQNGSKNKDKTRIKLAKYHEKLNNIKENYLYHTVNQLLSENQTIVIEDLNVKEMMKTKYLAKSIQELSLSRFISILTYKAKWYGRDIIEIDRWFPSSKLCSCCGYKNQNLTLNDRVWTCPNCKSLLNRDLNAALNIKNEGEKILKIGLSSPNLKPLETKTLV